MTAHELLVEARNNIATEDGWDIMVYGLWGPDTECGTPRCALGWMSWCAGDWTGEFIHNPVPGSAHERGVEALWKVRPEGYGSRSLGEGIAADVEEVAFFIDGSGGWRLQERQLVVDGECGVDGILGWFDQAIALTAPVPDIGQLPDVEIDDRLVVA
ncbi:hypothetical protein BH24ACT15_BH24ACT15_29960 [soil metagenome]